MTKSEIRIECGTGADITDEDAYWVSTDATGDDLESPTVLTIIIAKGTPLPVAATLLGMAEEVLLSEAIYEDEDEDEDEADTHISAN